LKPLSDEQRTVRFWAKVEKTDACWIWKGGTGTHGYGVVDTRRAGKRLVERAHRVAWKLVIGPIPKGLHVLHGCDNVLCVRPGPGHLHLGTHRLNMTEMAVRDRAAREFQKPNTKLSDLQAVEIRSSKARGRDLARIYNVSEQTICDIRNGRTRLKAFPKLSEARVDA